MLEKEWVFLDENISQAQAEAYAEINKDKFNDDNELYILAKDLVDAGLLPVDEKNNILSSEKDLSNVKIKVSMKNDKIVAEIIK